MKYLKYFESYRRKGPGELPLKEISKEEFKDFLQTNCKQFLEVVKDIDFTQYNKWSGPKQLIYRKFKMNYGNFVLTNPKESEHRRIAPWSDWGNWHNLLISNLDSWRKYPRRNKSMIVSGWDRAYGHGGTDLYLVIPFDRTKLGVCRGNDFWEAFNLNFFIFNILPIFPLDGGRIARDIITLITKNKQKSIVIVSYLSIITSVIVAYYFFLQHEWIIVAVMGFFVLVNVLFLSDKD